MGTRRKMVSIDEFRGQAVYVSLEVAYTACPRNSVEKEEIFFPPTSLEIL
jgi:hypothetical protein